MASELELLQAKNREELLKRIDSARGNSLSRKDFLNSQSTELVILLRNFIAELVDSYQDHTEGSTKINIPGKREPLNAPENKINTQAEWMELDHLLVFIHACGLNLFVLSSDTERFANALTSYMGAADYARSLVLRIGGANDDKLVTARKVRNYYTGAHWEAIEPRALLKNRDADVSIIQKTKGVKNYGKGDCGLLALGQALAQSVPTEGDKWPGNQATQKDLIKFEGDLNAKVEQREREQKTAILDQAEQIGQNLTVEQLFLFARFLLNYHHIDSAEKTSLLCALLKPLNESNLGEVFFAQHWPAASSVLDIADDILAEPTKLLLIESQWQTMFASNKVGIGQAFRAMKAVQIDNELIKAVIDEIERCGDAEELTKFLELQLSLGMPAGVTETIAEGAPLSPAQIGDAIFTALAKVPTPVPARLQLEAAGNLPADEPSNAVPATDAIAVFDSLFATVLQQEYNKPENETEDESVICSKARLLALNGLFNSGKNTKGITDAKTLLEPVYVKAPKLVK